MECSSHKLVADVTPVAAGQVVMTRYRDASNYDGELGWFLPDDLLEHGEHPDAGAARILHDQLGWSDVEPRLARIESFGGGKSAWHLVFHYLVELPERKLIEPGANVAEAAWFDLDGLPDRGEIAHHGWCADTLDAILPDALKPRSKALH
jgi:ADP-ribose pyrophosphatase YjhB (NUDIX family)